MYRDNSLKKYLDDLSARIPAPGGGSAAALTACEGIALVSMVVNFTIGKPKYAAYTKELEGILEKSEKLRIQFLGLVDADVQAYSSGNIRDSLDVPFMVTRLCFEAVKLCLPLIKKGNIKLISDVAVAAILLEAAFSSAYFNVEINLKYLEDKKFGRLIQKELLRNQKLIRKIRSQIELKVVRAIQDLKPKTK